MAQAHKAEGSGRIESISPAWRVFQLAVFVVALSYLVGWYIGGPTRFLDKAASGGLVQTWAGLILFASPLISVLLIVLAIWPNTLAALSEKKTVGAKVLLGIIFLFTLAWLVNALLYTPMYSKLLENPMGQAKVLPIPGGLTLHMVFQHWFQSAAVLVFALVPEKFSTLTQSESPAGLQCAIVDCG